MAKQRFPGARCLLIGLVAVGVTLGVVASTLARVAGGHGTRTDCYSEFDGIDATGGPTKVQCKDGDPCDQDHKCDGVCTFKIQLCINQHDVSGCTPPTSGLKSIQVIPPKFRSLASGLNGSKLSQSVCGDEGTIQVLAHPGTAARKVNKKGNPGKQPLRVVAKVKGGKPDLDAITLVCSPRPTGDPCPPPPTTTTTLPCPEATAPCTCDGGTPGKLSFVTGVGSGTCGHLDADGIPNFQQLNCGGLYFGGSQVGVPLPSRVPDQGKSTTKVCCSGTTLTLGPTTPGDAGGNRCAGGSNHHNACTTNANCPGGTCKFLQCTAKDCLFGPPLPVPNGSHQGASTSTCVINALSANASGMGDCSTGSTSNLSVPLSSQLFLDGDLLPNRCVGGTTPGAPCGPTDCSTGTSACPGGGTCTNDTGRCASGNGQAADTACCSDGDCTLSGACETGKCSGGTNANFGCIVDADCTGGGTCRTFIQPCPICNSSTGKCNGGGNDGLVCTAGDSELDGDYPTSHDCPPPPAKNIGALPISFVLDSGTVTKTAVDNTNINDEVNVYCGFCRNKTSDFFKSPAVQCDPAGPAHCVGGASAGTACTIDSACGAGKCLNDTCATVTGFTSCAQRTAGAFQANEVTRTISVTGTPSGALTTGGPAKPSTLVGIFCIPPSFNGLVDGAADLPGPGAVAIPGMAQAFP